MSNCPSNGYGCQCCKKLEVFLQREQWWLDLYMLQQRYLMSYKTMKAPSQKVCDGLAKFRRLLGLDMGILRTDETANSKQDK